ncbi:MAG: Cys-tRNA(Pro) deacylase [Bacteroides sp.]|nr:Cys-tRNA(Pro) deacylase [Bacteroides sp.]
MKGPAKTNAARILDRLKIPYELIPYEVDESNLAADHVAAQLGEPIERVYKTLTLRGDRTGVLVCVVAGNREVDLKKAAVVSGNKKVEMVHQKELLPLTGYIRGGCTSIGMKKQYPTFISDEAARFDYIYVSAGQRGLQLRLSPDDLLRAASAQYADVSTTLPVD